ncbi:hypothetical protein GCM10027594_11750 [Hymenobacter agri]
MPKGKMPLAMLPDVARMCRHRSYRRNTVCSIIANGTPVRMASVRNMLSGALRSRSVFHTCAPGKSILLNVCVFSRWSWARRVSQLDRSSSGWGRVAHGKRLVLFMTRLG